MDLCVAPNAAAFAAEVARRLAGTLVPLDSDRATYRIAWKDGSGPSGYWVDVVGRRGSAIELDLADRDFTIHAMAVPLVAFDADASLAASSLERVLVDPLRGLADLRARVVRMVSEANLHDDPLRTLRAVRAAAELRGSVEPATREAVRRAAPGLSRVSPERVREELVRLFEQPRTHRWIREIAALGMEEILFSDLAACAGVTQNAFHHLDVRDHSLETLRYAEGIARRPGRFFPEDANRIRTSMDTEMAGSTTRTYLKIVSLLHDVSKPETRTVESDGRVRFIGHDLRGEERVTTWAERWRFPNEAVQALGAWVRHHLRAGNLSGDKGPTRRTAYRFFRDLGPLADGAVVLSLADRLGARGKDWRTTRRAQMDSIRELLRIRRDDLSRPPKTRYLTGSDLLRELQLSPGPKIGALLTSLDEASALGEVSDRGSALAFLRKRMAETEGG